MTQLLEILFIGLAVASLSMTVAKSNVTERVRKQVSRLGHWASELIHCPYCLSHWFAFVLVWWRIGGCPGDVFVLTVFGVVTISSLASLGIARLFLALDEIDYEEKNDDAF